MILPESLTKENFWNALRERFPEAVEVFCKWVDAYKQAVGWPHLFGSVSYPNVPESSGLKFHDLPYHMQMGIWFAFVKYWDGEGVENMIDLTSFDLREHIIRTFEVDVLTDLLFYRNASEEVPERLKPFIV